MQNYFNFLIIFLLSSISTAKETDDCFPPCRSGFICYNGECISKCNPPCPQGQKCMGSGECVSINETSNLSDTSKTTTLSEPENVLKRKTIDCESLFIVRPEVNAENVGNNFEQAEFLIASNMVASAILSKYVGGTIIYPEDLPLIKNCNSQIILVEVKLYHTEPARMGQNVGIVTILIKFYDPTNSTKPHSQREFSAKGERHWGDSVPLQSAFKSVSEEIKRKL